MSFNIEEYLNSLDENITEIDVANENLTNLPELTRFKKLEILRCDNNRLTSLPTNLRYLHCNHNQLTSLPTFPNDLRYLHCNNNQLTLLPSLPNNLQYLRCYDNQLTSLPALPDNLKLLNCQNNKLHLLPDLPNDLQALYYNHNPIYSIIGNDNIYTTNINTARLILKKLNNIKYLYYALKFKKKFRKWLWERVRLPKIKNLYHPDNLISMLTDEEKDLDDVLEEWIEQ
jgi:Leucine-rich repeat (LRR) protein